MLIKANLAKDNIYTHLFSSFLAASGATVLTQDVCLLLNYRSNLSIPPLLVHLI